MKLEPPGKGNPHPEDVPDGVPPDEGNVSPQDELAFYRRRRAGMPINERRARHLDALFPAEIEELEAIADGLDEQDRRVREDIKKAREATSSTRRSAVASRPTGTTASCSSFRPHDRKEARTVRFVRLWSLARPRGAGRPRVAAARSSANSGDSNDSDSDSEPPRRRGRDLRHVSESLADELNRIAATLRAREGAGR